MRIVCLTGEGKTCFTSDVHMNEIPLFFMNVYGFIFYSIFFMLNNGVLNYF